MIFDDSSPYGEILNEDLNSNFEYEDTGDIGHLHGDPIGEKSGLNIESSKDSVSYHIENRKEILKTQVEEKIRNQSITNLLSFGIIAGVGVFILKRYWK